MHPEEATMTTTAPALPGDHMLAIESLLAAMGHAWADGDGTAYGALFTPDAHYVNAPGQRVVGASAIAESHQEIFDSFFRGTFLGSGYPREIEVIAPDIVLVHGSGAVLFPGEREEDVAPNGLMTMLLVKRDGRWLIDSFTNTQTGKHRNAKFIARYLTSRLHPFTAEWTKARRHMLDGKHRNMARYDRSAHE